jgi:hypothetical protein
MLVSTNKTQFSVHLTTDIYCHYSAMHVGVSYIHTIKKKKQTGSGTYQLPQNNKDPVSITSQYTIAASLQTVYLPSVLLFLSGIPATEHPSDLR